MPTFLADADFNRLLPDDLQAQAEHHFTPVNVARRAAQLLVVEPGAYVLDVGAAVGKFCIIGAMYSDGVFLGVERRPRLARVAVAIASVLDLPNVMVHQAELTEIDWTPFDGFYLFNPLVDHVSHLQFVSERLAAARVGTRVVTYHGYGEPLAPGYVLKTEEACGAGLLELWIKESAGPRRRTGRDEPLQD